MNGPHKVPPATRFEQTDALAPEMYEDYLALEGAASAAYSSFVYEDERQANEVRRALFEAKAGDVAARFVIATTVDGILAGVMNCMSGSELEVARTAASIVMHRRGLLRPDSGLAERLRLASGALWRPNRSDFYLSRIAVAPAFRRCGVAERLLETLIDRARSRGADRILLEVEPGNEPARRLYARAGFVEVATKIAQSGDRRLAYVLAELPLRSAAQPLASDPVSRGPGDESAQRLGPPVEKATGRTSLAARDATVREPKLG
jgi:ribosomal protein S18 acetylase RimI-like enzyme